MQTFPRLFPGSRRLLQPALLLACGMALLSASSQPTANPIAGAAKSVKLNGALIQQHQGKDDSKPNLRDNISAVVTRADLLVLGADEGADVLLFNRHSDNAYQQGDPACISLDGEDCGSERKQGEVDIEGLAWGEKYLYVLGSHSRARNRPKGGKTADENRKRLASIKIEPSREQLFRVKLSEQGKVGKKRKSISLRDLFANHPLLARFQAIPSKENGIDIEGLAVRQVDGDDWLYLGFRGPVLRGNHALVMALQFKRKKGEKKPAFKRKAIAANPIYYLNLNGFGIRGLAEAGDDGLLVLAGPVGDASTTPAKKRYPVYLWDGEQATLPAEPMQPLCYAPLPADYPDAKAEGIELLNKDRSSSDPYRLLFVYDGAKRGAPTVIDCKP